MTDRLSQMAGRDAGFMAASAPAKVWYAFRRWPILPLIVLALLVIAGVFAPLVSPNDPLKQELTLRNAPPFWYTE